MPRKIKGPFHPILTFDDFERKFVRQKVNLPPPEELPCIAQVIVQNGVENEGLLYLGKVEKAKWQSEIMDIAPTRPITVEMFKMSIVEIEGRQEIKIPYTRLLSFRIFHDKIATESLFRVTKKKVV